MRIINRRARHDFVILEKLEAGIELKGAEIKSIRAGRASLTEAHVRIINNEAFLINAYIASWMGSEKLGLPATKTRKLLLHRNQINAWLGRVAGSNLTIVPLSIYVKHNLAKVEIGLARAKRKHEKRELLRRRVIERETERELRGKE